MWVARSQVTVEPVGTFGGFVYQKIKIQLHGIVLKYMDYGYREVDAWLFLTYK